MFLKINRYLYYIIIILFANACKSESDAIPEFVVKNDQQLRVVNKATIAPVVDGIADDPAWEEATWYPIDQLWLGDKFDNQDFEGRFKLTWTPEGLYLLAEIKDDVLLDRYSNPLEQFWNEDCLELFIDADNSGGDHQFNYNAFAYHIALDGNVVDTDSNQSPRLYNSHVTNARRTQNTVSIWENRITVYDATYRDDAPTNPKILEPHLKMGFAVAYCDNDNSKERENFIGSIPVAGKDKNRGWIDAGIFGTIILEE